MGSRKGCRSDGESADYIHDGQESQVDIEICCGGGAVVLSPTTSVGVVVLGVEGSKGIEDAGAVGNGAVIAGVGTDEAAS